MSELDVERLARFLRYHPSLRGKDGEWVDGWDAATSAVIDALAAPQPLAEEPTDAAIPRMDYGVILTAEEQRELDRRLWQIEQARRQGNAAARTIPLGGAPPPLAAPQPVPEPDDMPEYAEDEYNGRIPAR